MVDEKLRIEYIRLDKAIDLLWTENPKSHHIQLLVESFQIHGFRDAPAFDEKLAEGGAIVDGNGRIEALWWMYNESQTNDEVKPPRGIALDDGMWCLPVQFGISAASKAAAESYALDANNLTLLGGEFTAFDIARMYDQEAYLAVLAETAAADVMPASVDLEDLEALYRGFGAETMAEAPEPQIDKAAELQEKWRVKTGQLWQIGEHRLICGDCTDKPVVEAVMGEEKAQLVWTDPPYGIKYGDKLNSANPMGYKVRTIEGDDLPPEELEGLIRSAFKLAAKHCVPGASIYAACPAGTPLPIAIAAFEGSGFVFHWQLVWVKNQLVLGRGDYHFRHENILYGWKQDGAHYFVNDRTQDSVFEIPRPRVSEEHPTMKPIELVSQMLANSSRMNDIIYDPFVGSGTTLIACEQLGRKCYAIDIEPKYCAVILDRWSRLTGETPVLIS